MQMAIAIIKNIENIFSIKFQLIFRSLFIVYSEKFKTMKIKKNHTKKSLFRGKNNGVSHNYFQHKK